MVIKLKYPRPNSIRVQNRGTTIKPITLRDIESEQASLDLTVCGSNIFFYENYTVHFVLTGHKDCQVRVSLTNSIQLTTKFSMSIEDFFANDGETKFINRICAALAITDYSRVKIVGVYNGSVTIQAYIEEPASTVDDAPSQDNDLNANLMLSLQATLNTLIDSGQMDTTFSDFGDILEFNSEVYDHPDPVVPIEPTDDGDGETVIEDK